MSLDTMEDLPGYTPQAISDILPIYRPQDADNHIRIYSLRQNSFSTQTLTLREDSTNPNPSMPYCIRNNKTGGFMNRKPHVIISSRGESKPIAEGRFDIHGTGTSISYFQPSSTQFIDLLNSQAQLLRTTIHGADHWWQPHPGNKGVLELTNETEEIVARFIYTAPVSQRTGSWPTRADSVSEAKKDAVEMDLGELYVVDGLAGGDSGREEILCSAVVVIERAKRRAANMTKSGPGLKGPASWGMGASPPGGFL